MPTALISGLEPTSLGHGARLGAPDDDVVKKAHVD